MNEIARVELPISASSKIITRYKTMGDLHKNYPKLQFVKYIYLDPADNKLKGVNPPPNIPVIAGSYITVAGQLKDIIKFAEDASNK